MRSIRNKTAKPLKIRLPRGKVLHLDPLKTGQIADEAVDRESIRELVKADQIEILDGGHGAPGSPGSPAGPSESTQGHQRAGVMHPKGDR